MKKLFALLSLIAIVSSCSLSQHFHFNQDFSGNYIFEFDMSELVGMMGDSDSTETEDMWADIPLDSLQDVYNAIEGINNTKVFVENDILKISYDFADVESLNKALESKNDGEEDEDEMYGMILGEGMTFESKGKNKLIFNAPSLATADVEDSVIMYMEMLEFTTEFSFEKSIKSVNNESLTVSDDAKSLTIEGNFGELMKGEKDLSFEVKLK